MAKELMEIGGFITSGAEIVNHDNTLSGNGTVDSPLGVVPGYNETVLFDGDSVSAVCSEPISNFNKLRVELKTPAFSSMHEETFDVGTSAGFFTCGGGVHYYGGVISTTDTTVIISGGTHVWFNANGCGSETSNSKIQKVIGINRKAQ